MKKRVKEAAFIVCLVALTCGAVAFGGSLGATGAVHP